MSYTQILRAILEQPCEQEAPSSSFSVKVTTFNALRDICEHMRLGELDLSGLHLPAQDLSGINFANAHLHTSQFDGVNFEGANFRKARFDYTSAEGASFRNADLRDCRNLYKLSAPNATFEGANLCGAELIANKRAYDVRMNELLSTARFSQTRITPLQYDQLVSYFGFNPSLVDTRFIVVV